MSSVLPHHEYRCTGCKKLLFKGLLIEGEVEIKCKACHTVTVLAASDAPEYFCAIKPCPNRITLKPCG